MGQWLRLPCFLVILVEGISLGATSSDFVGSKVCAGCHAPEYKRYMSTAMSQSAGAVSGISVRPGEVMHGASGARYRIDTSGRVRFSRGNVDDSRDAVFFIGSGAAARSFLWRSGDFLFQLPVSWYASQGWEMSPGFESGRAINLARPIEPECLECHATGIRHRPGTQNGYEWPPVAEGGIGCERCHGPGARHVNGAKGAIVNPAKLGAQERDSICAQCHLTGVERVIRAGVKLSDFRPGEDFRKYAVSFIWNATEGGEVHVTSHFERLETSRCKQAAGEKLWCGTCHDSHATPSKVERPAYYRAKCLGCHEASEHARDMPDCVSCHMPSAPAKDASRTWFTDHSIPRRVQPPATSRDRELRAFRDAAGPRELGLALARIANAQQQAADFERARSLLQRAYAAGARDVAALTVLAFLEDRSGKEEKALELYEQVAALDPAAGEALVNLGSIYAGRGRVRDATPLWERATEASPGLEAAWVKLASAYVAMGRIPEAVATARKCLVYHPDSVRARELAALAQ